MNVPANIACALVNRAVKVANKEIYGFTTPCESLTEVYGDYLMLTSSCIANNLKTLILNKYV